LAETVEEELTGVEGKSVSPGHLLLEGLKGLTLERMDLLTGDADQKASCAGMGVGPWGLLPPVPRPLRVDLDVH